MEQVNYSTFVFLDLETTGLPAFEYNKTKITELCLVAVQSQHLSLGISPRVQHKLSLCFNPGKLVSDEAEDITGLSNFLLEKLGWFSKSTVEAINLFLDHQPKPICLVAHNGNYFDFPILQAEINKTGVPLLSDTYCVDSIDIFKYIYWSELESDDANEGKTIEGNGVEKALKIQKINETTPKKGQHPENYQAKRMRGENNVRRGLQFSPSFKLEDIYRRLMKSEPVASHRAEGDTMMLLSTALNLGHKFVQQAKMHSKKFADIPPMTPGIRIGTSPVKKTVPS